MTEGYFSQLAFDTVVCEFRKIGKIMHDLVEKLDSMASTELFDVDQSGFPVEEQDDDGSDDKQEADGGSDDEQSVDQQGDDQPTDDEQSVDQQGDDQPADEQEPGDGSDDEQSVEQQGDDQPADEQEPGDGSDDQQSVEQQGDDQPAEEQANNDQDGDEPQGNDPPADDQDDNDVNDIVENNEAHLAIAQSMRSIIKEAEKVISENSKAHRRSKKVVIRRRKWPNLCPYKCGKMISSKQMAHWHLTNPRSRDEGCPKLAWNL